MSTPNQMPKKQNKLKVQVIDGLISVSPSTWTRKVLGKDGDGKETVENERVVRDVLRFPLAQNVSNDNVERAASRWLR